MLLEARSIFNSISFSLACFVGVVFSFTQVGCSTATDKAESRLKVGEPVSESFVATYEDVEAALKQAMIKYPQRIDNTEAGVFETDFVKGEARFKPAHETQALSNGYRYRLILRLIRGKKDDKAAVKISVTKQIQLVRDFFAEPDTVTSDGLEEHAILYRIGRELSIAKALARANSKSQPESN
jgi:hypothetical protein